MTELTLPPLPKQAGFGLDMHGEIVLFASNGEKEIGLSPGAKTQMFTADQMHDYARAAVAAAVPAGWQLVPIDPTREMMEAMPRMPALRQDGLPFRAQGWSLNAITNRDRWAAAIAAAPKCAEAAGWINVNDRLPEKHVEVLIAFAGQSTLASTGQYTASVHDHGGWCYPQENFGVGEDGDEWPRVTHWMPLPEAPGTPLEEKA